MSELDSMTSLFKTPVYLEDGILRHVARARACVCVQYMHNLQVLDDTRRPPFYIDVLLLPPRLAGGTR